MENLKRVYTRGFVAAWILVALPGLAEKTEKRETPTPPTVVNEPGYEQSIAKLNQQWASIAAILESPEYFSIQADAVSKWSCGKQAGHIALTLDMVADSVAQLLANPDRDTEGTITPFGRAMLKSGIIPRGVGKAPEAINPKEKSREELLAVMQSARKKWKALEGKEQAIMTCEARSPHPLGMFRPQEWVRFVGIHTAHHLKIVRDILAAAANEAFGAELREPADAAS